MGPLSEISAHIVGVTSAPIELDILGVVVDTIPVCEHEIFDYDKSPAPVFFRRDVRVNAKVRHQDYALATEIFMSGKPFTMKISSNQGVVIDGLFHAVEWVHDQSGMTLEAFSSKTHEGEG